MHIDFDIYLKLVEQVFWNTFGLDVQIFRKSGDNWLTANSSDLWTLKEHNSKAVYMEFEIEKMKIPDYKELD